MIIAFHKCGNLDLRAHLNYVHTTTLRVSLLWCCWRHVFPGGNIHFICCHHPNAFLQPFCSLFSFCQMFSRISVALAKSDAVTLEDLVEVIRAAYNPTPVTCVVENVYDVKAWLRPYTATLQHHSHPHAFRFKLNEHGDVEMSYRPWAKSGRKEWFPREGPFIILRQLPPGKPAVLKPDLKKCPTVKVIQDSVQKLRARMSTSQLEWWKKIGS